MPRDVHDVLTRYEETSVRDEIPTGGSHPTHEVVGRLHAVPPYEVYEVVVDGRRAVCKVDAHPRGDAATEGRVQAFAARETPAPAPEVLAVGDDHYLAAWTDDAPPQGAPGLDVGKARTMGAAMARFHEATRFDAPGIPRAAGGELGVESHPTWAATVEALLADSRPFVAEHGYGDLVDEVLALVREHPTAFEVGSDPVLCHGNWLPDHVGVDPDGSTPAPRGADPVSGRATCVIDFEHALVAPPAYDVWRTLGPLSGEEGHGTAFREGYEAVRALPEGFGEQAPAFQVINAVLYVEALYLQGNITGEAADERADGLAAFARERLADLRDRVA